MKRLISEQLPSDGGFYLTDLIKDANAELKKIGEHGKTCQLKRSGNSITLQFNFGGQQNKGCSCRFTIKGIERALQIARLVTTQLIASNFSWEWYDRLLKKEKKEPLPIVKSFKAQIEEYKRNWFKENQKLRYPEKQWLSNYLHIEKVSLECDRPIDESIIKKIVDLTPNDSHTRRYTINALINVCDCFNHTQFIDLLQRYKKKNKPIRKNTYKPDDNEIEYIFQNGFKPGIRHKKDLLYRLEQWQFLYSLLAIYGLRIHECWKIANWDNPVTLKNDDWIVVDSIDGNQEFSLHYSNERSVIPAILDPSNDDKILCISHETKTGYRMAIPLSPRGKNWIKEFNLIQPFNLPDMPNPLKSCGKYGGYVCASNTCKWFSERKYGFTPHALRHAYNHRGHSLGYNPSLLAESLGHGLQMNTSTYLKHMSETRKLENFKNAIIEQTNKQSRLEELEIENIQLKAKIEMLETKLQLIYQERSGNM